MFEIYEATQVKSNHDGYNLRSLKVYRAYFWSFYLFLQEIDILTLLL